MGEDQLGEGINPKTQYNNNPIFLAISRHFHNDSFDLQTKDEMGLSSQKQKKR